MITILLPDQVATYWDILGYAIEQSLPPIASSNEERMNRVLTSLISGESLCWVSFNNGRIEAVCVTQIFQDIISRCNSLLIYSLYGFVDDLDSIWAEGISVLAKYAKAKNCEHIIAYTDNERIIEMTDMFGGNSRRSFVSFNANHLLGG